MSAQLKERLVAIGFSPEEISQADNASRTQKVSVMHALENLNKVPSQKLVEAYGGGIGCQIVHLEDRDIPPNIINLIPKDIAMKQRVVPIDRAGNNVIVATGNPLDLNNLQVVQFKTGFFVRGVLASEHRISEALQKYYGRIVDFSTLKAEEGGGNETGQETRQVIGDDDNDEVPVIRLVNYTLQECVNRRASDIHFEVYETTMRIRLRIDGELVELVKVPLNMKGRLITRVKIMSNMNISETRIPQDMNMKVVVQNRPIDFRVSTVPTVHGEKIVMRILDKSSLQVDMTKLGFDQPDLIKFKDSIESPFGMVLVTGPTGSGKTTTLYSALAELNKSTENIMTAEDPVEFNLEGINQVQIRTDVGMTFATALRAFLRQDPDVIMVGEVRDLETAEISIKAALTGHMVLSTLHTNSAPETISRLMNMGVEPFNLVSALTCIVAQRLMRRICDKCKVIDEQATPEALIDLGIHPNFASKIKVYKGKGCPACNGSGGRGRVAVHEVLKMNDAVRMAVIEKKPALEIKHIAMATGMRTMRQAALYKMSQGIVSVVEVTKTTISDTDAGDGSDEAVA